MPLPPFPIGLHIILTPKTASEQIPCDRATHLLAAAQFAAEEAGCTYKAAHAERDHLHVLVVSSDETHAAMFFDALVERTVDVIRESTGYRTFSWNERVHLTLLLPWHVDVFASFVRDQRHYHATHTLAQELEDIFFAPQKAMRAT